MVERGISDSEVQRLSGRYLFPLMCTFAMILASLVGSRVMSQQDEIAARVEALQIDMAIIKTDVKYLKQSQETKR